MDISNSEAVTLRVGERWARLFASVLVVLMATGCAGLGAAPTTPPLPTQASQPASSPNVVWGAAACPSPATSPQRPTTYVVRAHDTAGSIAACFEVTPAQLHAANPGIPYATGSYTLPDGGTMACSSPCMQLKPGDVLVIPAPGR
jgi:LysM domain